MPASSLAQRANARHLRLTRRGTTLPHRTGERVEDFSATSQRSGLHPPAVSDLGRG